MANKKLKVAAGHYHLFHRVAPTVANAKGYFAKEGLEVEISATGTDLKSLQALIEDEIDIVIDLKTPVALQARDRGEEVFLIGGFLNTYDFKRAGYSILADLEEYLPNGYQLRAIAVKGSFLERNRETVVGFLAGLIRGYRFMKNPENHPEMMAIIKVSDLEFEQDMDQGMWEEEYPLIPGIPANGSINVAGLQVILDEEKIARRISPAMTVDRILRPEYAQEALRKVGRP